MLSIGHVVFNAVRIVNHLHIEAHLHCAHVNRASCLVVAHALDGNRSCGSVVVADVVHMHPVKHGSLINKVVLPCGCLCGWGIGHLRRVRQPHTGSRRVAGKFIDLCAVNLSGAAHGVISLNRLLQRSGRVGVHKRGEVCLVQFLFDLSILRLNGVVHFCAQLCYGSSAVCQLHPISRIRWKRASRNVLLRAVAVQVVFHAVELLVARLCVVVALEHKAHSAKVYFGHWLFLLLYLVVNDQLAVLVAQRQRVGRGDHFGAVVHI